MTTESEKFLAIALEATGAKIYEERARADKERERWAEVASTFAALRKRMHDDGTANVLALDELQAEVFAWQTKNFGEQESENSLLGCVEEVGELCHAVLKQRQGIRGTPEEHVEAAKDSIGDLMIFLLNYCSGRGWSLEEILLGTWAEVSKRDWIKFPHDGLTR